MAETAIAKQNINLTAQYPANKFNLLSPVTIADSEAAFLRVRAVEVPLTEDDFYASKGKHCPHKEALLKIASAAGLILDPDRTGEIEPVDRSHPANIAYKAVGAVLTDSGWRMMTATYQWNHEAQKQKLKEDEFKQQYENRWALAETKALLRLIRAICATKQAYTKEEMARPFVVVRTELNTEDPQVKVEVARRALSAGSAIFGGGPQPKALPAGTPDFQDAEFEDVSGKSVDPETGEILNDPPERDDAGLVPEDTEPPEEPEADPDPFAGPYQCAQCGKDVSFEVATYCLTKHEDEFGGKVYCQDCGRQIMHEKKEAKTQ